MNLLYEDQQNQRFYEVAVLGRNPGFFIEYDATTKFKRSFAWGLLFPVVLGFTAFFSAAKLNQESVVVTWHKASETLTKDLATTALYCAIFGFVYLVADGLLAKYIASFKKEFELDEEDGPSEEKPSTASQSH